MQRDNKQPTSFAPAERALPETLSAQYRLVADNPLVIAVCNAVTEHVVVLNGERQIVYCNESFAALVGVSDPQLLLGFRPGEAMGCMHASEQPGGCGTTDFCAHCGAVKAILNSQNGVPDIKECTIRAKGDDAFDLEVKASPIKLGDQEFTVFAITDIAHQKRVATLERIFFHDIMNTAAGISMSCELHGIGKKPPDEIIRSIARSSAKLIDEVRNQRDLMDAEKHRLNVNIGPIDSLPLLGELVDIQECGLGGRRIIIDAQSQNISFMSDRVLLARVLGNMLKNAVEASGLEETVAVGCGGGSDRVKFWVRNPAVLPGEIQLQMFNRSFSTKGPGRGLGTYSMKLLTERYLKGGISFVSSARTGTVFYAEYPLSLEQSISSLGPGLSDDGKTGNRLQDQVI